MDEIKKEEVQEDEIVTNDIDQSQNNDSTILLSLEQLIKSHITRIDKLKDELKKHKEMLNSILDNDSTYKEHSQKAKEAARIKSKTKQEILKQPQVAQINEKVKNSRFESKELSQALSDYLREYQKMTGVNEIEGEDGEVREIIYTARLIKKSSS